MAINLANKPGVDVPNGQYPFGKPRDNDGSGNGFPANVFTHGDLHQFFAKLMDLAGAAYNNLPDNATDGFQYITALQTIIQSYIDALKGGVPAAGDTLSKLYTLITAMGRPRGGFDASLGAVPAPTGDNEAGDFWRITVAGTIGTMVLKPGDVLIASIDDAAVAADFYAVQSNVDQATTSVLGLVKLYTDLAASNVDGSVTQAAVKSAVDTLTTSVNNKVAKAGDTMTGPLVGTTGEFQDGIRTRNSGSYFEWIEYDIPLWDMDTDATHIIAHGLSAAQTAKIRGGEMVIFANGSSLPSIIGVGGTNFINWSGEAQLIVSINATNIVLTRRDAPSAFDTAGYNAATGKVVLMLSK